MAEPLSLEDRAKRALQAITGECSSFKEKNYNGTIIAEFSAVINERHASRISSIDMGNRLKQIKIGSNTNLEIKIEREPLADKYHVVTSFKLNEHNVRELEKQARELYLGKIERTIKNSAVRLGADQNGLINEVAGRIAKRTEQKEQSPNKVETKQQNGGYSNSPYKITGNVPGGTPADKIDGISAAAISGGNKHQRL